MIGRRAVIGLGLLSALLVCAFAAQSASALVVTKSNNTTAFTCVPDPSKEGDFKDAHCDVTDIGKGSFEHELIPLNTTTKIAGTNSGTKNNTTESTPAVLKGTIGLAKVAIECTTVENDTKEENSAIHNVEPGLGKHTVTGAIRTKFTNCNVKELAKCIVAEPIESTATIHGVEGMEGPLGEKNAMGVEFVGSQAEETFAKIEFKNKGVEACSLNAKTFPVKGRVVATNGPTDVSPQEGKETGATLVFTPKSKMQTLKLGPNVADFTAIATSKMAPDAGKPEHPISLTTTT